MNRAANKEMKRRARADKRKYMGNLASLAGEAAAPNEQGTVYKITNVITDKCHTDGEQERRWTEHFREVLNRPPPSEVPNIQVAATDLDISTDIPTRRV